jgi:hypothetical protein
MKKWQALSLVMLIFMIGVASGAQGTRLVVQHQVRAAIQKGPEGLRELLVARLDRDLDLDRKQRAEVVAILADSEREFRGEIQPRMNGIIGRAELRIQRVLVPNQQKVFDRSIRERRTLWSEYDAKLALQKHSGRAGAAGLDAGARFGERAGANLQGTAGHGAAIEGMLVGHGVASATAKAQGRIDSNGLAASASLGSPELGQAGARASVTRASGAAADAALVLPGGGSATAKAGIGRQGLNAAAQLSDPVSGARLAPSVSLSRDKGITAEVQARPGVFPAAPQPHSGIGQRANLNHATVNSLPSITIPARR